MEMYFHENCEMSEKLCPTNGESTATALPVNIEDYGTSVPLDVTTSEQTCFMEMTIILIDCVRKWGLSYDGGGEPLQFIERLEELAEIYGISLNQLPRIMPEFLHKRARIWFRNNNARWQAWSTFKLDFVAFFLSARYFEKLENEIQTRIQRENETFKDYVLAIQSLMRHSNLTEEQKLQRIFQNSLADYQRSIKRDDFSSLAELSRLVEDFESIYASSLNIKTETPEPSISPLNCQEEAPDPSTSLPNSQEETPESAASTSNYQQLPKEKCHLMPTELEGGERPPNFEEETPDSSASTSNYQDFPKEKRHLTPTEMEGGEPPSKRRKHEVDRNCLQCQYSCLTAPLLLDGKLVEAIIDTGSSKNYIREGFLKKLTDNPKYVSVNIKVGLVDGSTRIISRAVEFQTALGEVLKKVSYIVMPDNNNDLIIGIDFLRKFNTTIQLGGLTLKCSAGEIQEDCHVQNSQEMENGDDATSVNSLSSRENLNRKDGVPLTLADPKINSFQGKQLTQFQNIPMLSTNTTHKVNVNGESAVSVRCDTLIPAKGCVESSHCFRNSPANNKTCMDFEQSNLNPNHNQRHLSSKSIPAIPCISPMTSATLTSRELSSTDFLGQNNSSPPSGGKQTLSAPRSFISPLPKLSSGAPNKSTPLKSHGSPTDDTTSPSYISSILKSSLAESNISSYLSSPLKPSSDTTNESSTAPPSSHPTVAANQWFTLPSVNPSLDALNEPSPTSSDSSTKVVAQFGSQPIDATTPLPEEVQARIDEVQNRRNGKRIKFRHIIEGIAYNIIITRNGLIRVRIKKLEEKLV